MDGSVSDGASRVRLEACVAEHQPAHVEEFYNRGDVAVFVHDGLLRVDKPVNQPQHALTLDVLRGSDDVGKVLGDSSKTLEKLSVPDKEKSNAIDDVHGIFLCFPSELFTLPTLYFDKKLGT